MVTNSSTNTPTGASGTVLQGQGIGTANAFSTATYPSTATGTGTILRADGTNWSATTSTYPNTNAANTLLYASSANTMAALATANNGVLTTGTGGAPVITSLASDGQLIIGSSAGAPAAATITAGTNITVTNGHNSISIAATGGGSSSGTLGSPTTITSTATVNYSGISAVQANVIYFNYAAIKKSGTNVIMVRVGPSGGVVSSGYIGAYSSYAGGSPVFASGTISLGALGLSQNEAATTTYSGQIIFSLLDATNFIYTFQHAGAASVTGCYFNSGKIALSGLLDQITLLINGTGTFNAGEVNVLYYT